jgi:hypothetical protein
MNEDYVLFLSLSPYPTHSPLCHSLTLARATQHNTTSTKTATRKNSEKAVVGGAFFCTAVFMIR